MGNSAIHADHRKRMRERFAKNGIEGFQDHEVLEVLLYSVIPRRNTNDIAHRLLEKFGSLAGVLSANRRELCGIDGIGKISAEHLCFLGEIFSNVGGVLFQKVSLNTAESVGMYAVSRIGTAPSDSALSVYLDKSGFRICEEWLYRGRSRMTDEIDKHIIAKAVENGASSVILMHNHKNEPQKISPEDAVITERLRRMAEDAGINKLWHVIVSDDGYIHI